MTSELATATRIHVASVPADHPYVRHLTDPDRPTIVRRLPDPRPDVPSPAPGQWWPPRMLEPDWVDAHHREFDLLHLHFGFDAATPAGLERWTDLLRSHHLPLVVTVHDLTNPHFVNPASHQANLDVLVPAAAEVITLTAAAAAEIQRRWGRTATVIPHPHIVPLDRVARPRPMHDGFVIGVHAKSLRANIDPLPVLRRLAGELASMPGAVLQLDVHPDVMDPDNRDERALALRSWVADFSGHPNFRLAVHPRFTDDELWDYLQSIDLCVLPYRFGTHSGWLEACVDLGTGVVVPATGHFAGQHGHPSYGPGTAGLVEEVRSAHAASLHTGRGDDGRGAARRRADPLRPDRRRQRRQIAVEHEEIYRRVLADLTAPAHSTQIRTSS